jgi:hypothetical protein
VHDGHPHTRIEPLTKGVRLLVTGPAGEVAQVDRLLDAQVDDVPDELHAPDHEDDPHERCSWRYGRRCA